MSVVHLSYLFCMYQLIPFVLFLCVEVRCRLAILLQLLLMVKFGYQSQGAVGMHGLKMACPMCGPCVFVCFSEERND